MPLQNRVTPLGELVVDPGRGLVYGNRGCLHDRTGRIRRRCDGKRWIVVAPPRGTTTIALVAATDHQPASVETGIRLISRDAETDHAALIADGVDADPALQWDGVPPMFAFRDQDGNGLEIVQETRS